MSTEKTVLIIDDEQPVSRALGHKLSAAGYKVVTANNGDDGLEKINESTPDLVILDLIMPESDGFDVLEELDTKKLPVFVFSNLSEKEDRNRADKLGAEKFLIKTDVQLSDVVDEVDKFFA